MSPDEGGPRAFGRRVRSARFPSRFKAPTSVPKYNGESDPSIWLENYRLGCQAGGANDELFMVRLLPLYLDDSARAWIQHLPASSINNWRELRNAFIGNFQGTYTRPSTTWDLRACRQEKNESLRDYIRRFSKLCNTLADPTDAEIIGAFTFGTTCETLIRELGVCKPRTVKQLLDLATDHAEGEEALSAVKGGSRARTRGAEEAGEGPASRRNEKKKKNQGKRPRHEDKDEFVGVADKRKGGARTDKTPPTKDHFEKLLEEPCPHHQGPVKHKMKDCHLMKKFVQGTLRSESSGGGRGKDAAANDAHEAYVEEDVVAVVFGGAPAYESRRMQKLTRREVLFTDPATPTYLDWSREAITFDRGDHPRHIPQPGRYPLVVDPIIGTKRLRRVLMDGGSGLNLLYIDALDALGIPRARLRPSPEPIHGVVPGKQMTALGRIDLPVTFGTPTNFRKEVLTFEVLPFRTAYHALLGRPCYAKFMAVPNYTYLKLKLPGPKGVITVDSTFEHAFNCDNDAVQCADAAVRSNELQHKMTAWTRTDDDPELKKVHAASSSSTEQLEKVSGAFEPDKDAKEVAVDEEGRTLRVGTELTPK